MIHKIEFSTIELLLICGAVANRKYTHKIDELTATGVVDKIHKVVERDLPHNEDKDK